MAAKCLWAWLLRMVVEMAVAPSQAEVIYVDSETADNRKFHHNIVTRRQYLWMRAPNNRASEQLGMQIYTSPRRASMATTRTGSRPSARSCCDF